jgi:hypothetical protein
MFTTSHAVPAPDNAFQGQTPQDEMPHRAVAAISIKLDLVSHIENFRVSNPTMRHRIADPVSILWRPETWA